MIARVRGVLVGKGPSGVVVEVGGVGYRISMTPRGLSDLPPIGEELVLHTHLHVREDALDLFGFPVEAESELFGLLLGASGVGPKMALSILATMQPSELRRALAAEDVAALALVPGIGRRTAQKLILELRPRFSLPDGELPSSGSPLAEVRDALEGLGYGVAEIREAMVGLAPEGEVEQLLRDALQQLGRR